MEKGLFITMEGTDGSGKSTQIELLKSYFAERGLRAVFTREPGGTAISEKIRALILDRNNAEMVAMTEALLYAASRAQLVSEVIRPALERGETVVCDRYVDSSVAYQGFGRGLGDCIRIINEQAVGDCVPDITFLLKINPEIGKSRIRAEEQDRLEQEKEAFHRSVYDGYLQLEGACGERIVGIDATGSVEAVSREIRSHIDRLLRLRDTEVARNDL